VAGPKASSDEAQNVRRGSLGTSFLVVGLPSASHHSIEAVAIFAVVLQVIQRDQVTVPDSVPPLGLLVSEMVPEHAVELEQVPEPDTVSVGSVAAHPPRRLPRRSTRRWKDSSCL
jgi:hypothetical protein